MQQFPDQIYKFMSGDQYDLTMQNKPSESSNRLCFNRIHLNNGIGIRNFIGCLIHYFMLSFVFVSVDSLQPMLLQNKFQIDKKDTIQNFRNATVIAFDITVKILTAPLFGYFADRRGRKTINLYGIICIGITMMLMPYSFNFYVYVLLRCIYAQGAIAISVVPLLADYIHQESRGTCAALLVFMSSIGAVSSAFINFTILDKVNGHAKLYLQYGVISILILLIGIAYTLICLKKGSQYYLSGGQNQKRSTSQLLKVFKMSIKHPEISTGYLAALLARSDSILLSLYLVLWTYSFDHSNYDESSKKASALSGIAYTVIMLVCIVYGILYSLKNINRKYLMIAMLALAMVGSTLINLVTEINSLFTYFSLGILGAGMSGLLTASLYLVNQYAESEYRGYITGIQTFFGVIGIILQTVIGAILYEYSSRNGPFCYFASMCLLAIFFTIVIYKMNSKRKQQQQLSLLSESDQQIQN